MMRIKRTVSLLLALVMTLQMFPVYTHAHEVEEAAVAETAAAETAAPMATEETAAEETLPATEPVFTEAPAETEVPVETTAGETEAPAETAPSETEAAEGTEAAEEESVPEPETTEAVTVPETEAPEETAPAETELEETLPDISMEAAAAASGSCGTYARWSLSDDGVLTISGSGAMTDYTYDVAAPWTDYASSIKEVIIQSGITSIGSRAFWRHSALTKATIASTVTAIGDSAFYDAGLAEVTIPSNVKTIGGNAFYSTNIASINIPASVTSVGNYAFESCSMLKQVHITDLKAWCGITFSSATSNPTGRSGGLILNGEEVTELVIPSGVTKIGDYAFYNCSKLTSVTIPSGVKSIGSYAFYYCQSLRSVTVPSGVTGIGSCAFYYCTKLESVSLPNTVTSLGYAAFNGCRMLTSVNLPTGLALIDRNTFYGCEKLESVTIPSGVTEIGYAAFQGCKALKQLVIPSKVTKIGDYAFQSCEALESVTIPSGVTAIGNYAFYYCGALTGVTLPTSLTTLGYGAFSNCVGLETVSIPAALTSIGSGAFSGCTGLKKITVSASNTAYSADSYGVLFDKNKTVLMQAPAGLSGSYSIPATVRTVDGSAFSGCSALTAVTIPSGVTEIGSGAFQNCKALTAVVLPETVTSLGSSAFANCENLVSANIPKGVTELGDYTFYYCKSLAAVTIPEGVTEIGSYAFRGCAALKSVVIPDSVKTMYYDVFEDCTSLESVTIGSGITRIESMCFQNCTALKEVVIPDSVERIYDFTFCNCSSLESVTVGSGVEYIGTVAFYDCEALETIRFRGPAPDVDDRAFEGVTATAYYPYGEESWNSGTLLDYGGHLTWVPYRAGDAEASGTCGEGLTWSLLDGEVWIEGSGEMADYSQTPAPWSGLGFTALRIGENVRSIGAYAFGGCTELTKIIFLGDAPVIGENAFEGVTATADYYVGTEAWENTVKSGYGGSITWNPLLLAQGTSNATSWTLTNYGLLTISGSGAVGCAVADNGDEVAPWYRYSDKVVDVVVAPQITELGDTFWNDGGIRGFANVRSLTLQGSSTVIQYSRETTGLEAITVPESHSLYATVDGILYSKDMTQLLRYPQNHPGSTVFRIPDSVTTLGYNAFAKCQRLTEIIIPGTVTSMGGGQNSWQSAFYDCVSLEKVTLGEGITQIGGYAFYNCTALTDVALPESLTTLGNSAFGYCTALTEIALPEGVTTLGTNVFGNCKALREVVLPEGITEIPNNAFYNCTALEQVTLGSQVTKIGTQAFYSCKALTEVKIPATVTAVGNNAFLNCANLTAVRFFGDAPTFGTSVFKNAPSLTVYYYANNTTWTEEVRQAAGADVIWKGVCGSGHTLVTTPGIPATCTQPGISDGSYCSECTLVLSERQVVPATGHSFEGGACTGCGITGGECGTDVTWSLENGILTVSGTGAMTNPGEMPWGDMRESIVEVIIQPGVTVICSYAFDGCENMVKVTIPDTVIGIADYAFEGCGSLAAVEIPDSVTYIGEQAFAYCESLTTVTIPGSVKGMLYGTFLECTGLTSAVIGDGVEELYATFLYCSNLAEIRFLGAAPEIYFLAASYYDTVPLTAYYPYGDPTWTDEVLCDYGRPITWVPYRQGEAGNSGSCGENLTWTLDEQGTLWIEGEGAMEDYSASNPAPWNGLKITAVRVGEGVTRIGSYAFRNCTSLSKIEFTGEAPAIGTNAFYGVLASAEYPAGNKGWDTVSQSNYGGTIIWTGIYRAQGSCGTGVSWKLTMDGVLTVTGSGAVTYTNAEGDDCAWWYNYAGQIKDVVVGPNITDMGEFFFTGANADSFESAGFVNLRSITLQGSKTAFTLPDTRYMPALESITIPSGNSQYATVDGILYSADKKSLVLYPRNYQGGTDFAVPGTVTAIGDYAFHKAATLVNVTIPDSVTAVGEWAFSESTALETVTMGDGVTQIGTYAFYLCKKLRSVTLGSGVESIGKYAFYSCKALEELDLGGTRVIGERAFSSCTALTALTLPDTLEEIGDWAFSHCDGLTAVDVSNGVETIGTYAFGYCGNLTEVRLGTGVTSLGKYVFSNSKKLNTLRFYGDAPSFAGNLFSNITVTAYYYAGNNTWTADVRQDYGGTITWVGVCGSAHTEVVSPAAAATCEKAGLTEGRYCSMCMRVLAKQEVIPALGHKAVTDAAKAPTCEEPGLTEGSHCENCGQIYTAQQQIPATGHAFDEESLCTRCGAADLLGSGSCGENVTWQLRKNGKLVISGNGAMTDWVNSSGAAWYSNRKDITSVVIEKGVTSIGGYAFYQCSNMQSVAVPAGITAIGQYAFYGCWGLEELTIPAGVKTIGKQAFASCSNVTRFDIPDSVTSLGEYAFTDCAELVSVTIGSGVTAISSGAFYYCTKLKNVTLGDNVASIGSGAFYHCSSLAILRLPDGLESIGSDAFGYSGLKALYIPAGVTDISGEPFGYSNMNMILYCGAPSKPAGWSAEWNYYRGDDGLLVNWGVSRQVGDFWTVDVYKETVVIPSFVAEIPTRAFYYRTDMTGVTIPDSVTSIGAMAFYYCNNLSRVEIPGSVKTIGGSAFANCMGLTEAVLGSGVESIGSFAFENCTGLTGVAIPDTVTEMGSGAFANCAGITEVTLGKGQISVTQSCFEGCTGLKTVTIPDNIETVAPSAFEGCTGLEEVTFGSGLSWIGAEAFKNCTALTGIEIPDGVDMGSDVFYGCTGLAEIRFLGDAPESMWNWSDGFYGVTAKAYYPANNDTWTAELMKNYGGTITWVPDCQGRHTPVTDEAVAPGCDTTGLTEGSHCGVCGEVLEEQQAVPAAHTPVTDEAVAPTCTQPGWTEGSHCDLCGEILKAQEMIPASHTVVTDEAVEATCSRPGLTEGSHCSACGEVFEAQQELPATGHDFQGDTCANCGAVTGSCGEGLTWILEEGELTVSGSGDMGSYSLGGAPWYSKRGSITKVVIGADVTAVGSYAFAYCTNLKTVTFLGDAPDIGSNAFYKVTAEAFYGGDWPEETLQNYGGTLTWTDPCGGNHSPVTDEAVEATCTRPGLTEGSHCGNCGKVIKKQAIVEALGHDMGPWEILEDPTCTEEGRRRQVCGRCGHSETEGIVPNGHNYESTVTVPGCETQGYTSHLCLTCGHSYVNGYTDPVGHNMGTWKTVTAATCLKEGQQRRECSRCEHFETGVLDALGHDLSVITAARPATCTEDGEETHGCSRCDFSETVILKATGHDYESVVTEPGCETVGYTTHTCRNCGHSYTDGHKGALGHDVRTRPAVEPTCTKTGLTEGRYCDVCGTELKTQQVVEALGHSPRKLEAVEATCTKSGLTEGVDCAVCGEVLTPQQTVKALGHEMGGWSTELSATCTKEGRQRRDCGRCDHYETKTIQPTGHTQQILPGKAATCTEAGLTEGIFCTVCETVLTAQKPIDAKGHSEKVLAAKAATCTEPGLTEGKVCTVCNAVLKQQETVEAKGHTPQVQPAVEPTCTKTGLTEGSICAECQTVLEEQQVVEATGHTFENFQCGNCGAYASASGSFGDSISWYVDAESGQLVITGTGTLEIPEEAFWEEFGDAITGIVIGEGITGITGTLAEGLDMLTGITIPASVTDIDPRFFDYCPNLSEILVEAGNPSYSDRDGILFSADGTELVRYPGGREDTDYTVPEGVDTVGPGAFSGNEYLETLRFTGPMPQIGEGAFEGMDVTVYYPGGDPTWDPELLGGGNWIPEYEGCEVIAITAECGSLLPGESVTLTALLNREEDAQILWEITEGADAARLIPDGETALLTAGTVAELTTVTVTARNLNGVARPAEIHVDILPQVRSLALLLEEENVTGKTVWWDRNAGPEEMVFTVRVEPAGARGQVDWTVSDPEALFARYITDSGSLTVCGPTGRNGTVTVTATAADGSGATASFDLKFTSLKPETEEIPGEDPADVNLLSGKSKNLVVYDDSTGKALTAKEISWSMDQSYAPFAKIDAKGKLTAKMVVEKVRVETVGTIVGSEGTTVTVTADIFPAVSSLELTTEEGLVNGKTLNVDVKGEPLVLTAELYPLDAMEGLDWVISDKKNAFADYAIEGNVLTVTPKPDAKAGSVTVKVTSADGSKKTATVKLAFGAYAEKVTIDRSVTRLVAGDKAIQLTAAVEPAALTKSGVVWSLKNPDDKNYVSLTAAGKITPKNVLAPAAVTVIATSKDGMASDEHTIEVLPREEAQLVLMAGNAYVTKTTQVLDVNKTESITISAHTYGQEGMTGVEWSPQSAKGTILTKQEDGSLTVQMTAAASVSITAKAADGRKATVTVKGVKLASAVEIAQKKTGITGGLELASGQSLDLEARLADAASKKVTWSLVRGGAYATLSSSGKLTAAKDLTSARTVAVRAEAEGGAWDEMEVTLRPLARGVQVYSEAGGRMLFSLRSQNWWVRSNTTLNWDPDIQGSTISLNAHVYPYYGEDDSKNAIQDVTWTSSAAKVARIETDGDGSVRLVCTGTGSTTVTATANDGSKVKVSFKLNVIRGITELALEDQTMLAGKKLDLSKLVTVGPENTTNRKLNWQLLEGGEYATLSNAGALTAKKGSEGKRIRVRVTPAETTAENVYAECTVTIYPATTRIAIFDVEENIEVTGQTGRYWIEAGADTVTAYLRAVAYPCSEDKDPFNDASQKLVWTSSNSEYARVEDGVVTLYRSGIGKTVTITATSTDGSGKKASVKLRILSRGE